MKLPQLDLANIDMAALDSACQTWGSFTLQGHDIDADLQQEVLELSRCFFGEPLAIKNQTRRSAQNAWGYFDAELTKNRRDWKEIVDIGPAVDAGPLAGSTPQWPDISGFKATMETFSAAMHEVALEVVRHIAKALACDDDLTAPFAAHSSFLRLNSSPACPEPAPADAALAPESGHLGISHHTDAGAVTVLLQDDQPGLQICQQGRWHIVEPPAGALIINTGDIVQVWSNDRYPAPVHRVLVNAKRERYSLPYFLNPDYNYDYAPIGHGLAAACPPPASRSWRWTSPSRRSSPSARCGSCSRRPTTWC